MPLFTVYKNEYTPAQINSLCSIDGALVLDKTTNRIYCGINSTTNSANLFGSMVQNATYNTNSGTLILEYCDGSSVNISIDRITAYTSPVYNITGDLSFDTAIENNAVQNNDTHQQAINKLDNKTKILVDAIVNDERVIIEGFDAIKTNVGLDSNFRYTSNQPSLQNITTVHDAIDALAVSTVGLQTVVNTSSNGLAPTVTNTNGFLKGDGTWVVVDKISNYNSPNYQVTTDVPFDTAIQNNTVQNNDALQIAINKLDNKGKAFLDAIIDNENVTEEAFSAVKNSVGLDNDFKYSSNVPSLQNINNIHDALDALAVEMGTTYGIVSVQSAGLAPVVTNTNGYLQGNGQWVSLNWAENTFNKVTTINSNSTNTEYPSAKAVYDALGDINSILEVIVGVQNS